MTTSDIDAAVQQHRALVEGIARNIHRKLPPHVDMADLVADGYLGLIDALGRYDPDRGPVENFVRRRIRGAIMDGLRGGHRHVVQHSEVGFGDNPDSDRWLRDDSPAFNTERLVAQRLQSEVVRAAMHAVLNPRYITALEGYFWRDMSTKEVGEIIGATESRASAIIRVGLQRMRKYLAAERKVCRYRDVAA